MTTFKDLGLHETIMKSLDELGFEKPSPIQKKSIPFILESKQDLIALAQTGTGKTAAFSLPILNQIDTKKQETQAIILCPTRELCIQIANDIKNFSKNMKGISITAAYGGERIDFQIRSLKKGSNIVVGTPGRVCDLIRRGTLKLDEIEWLVLDEADEMLDMGFKEDLDMILAQTPETRQTLLFSATISASVRAIAKRYMKKAHEISVASENAGADKVSHEYYVVQARDRFEALKRILDHLPGIYGILFCRTRHETQEVADKLKQSNYDAEAMHGDISQAMRTKIMDRFKKKRIKLLVATDVAARGIDVNNLSHVINYNLPDQNEVYTHRSGRTGRAQNSGVSLSIVNMREVGKIRRIESILGKRFEKKQIPQGEEICKKQIDNFLEEVINNTEQNILSEELTTQLQKVKKDDLIKYLINHKFSYFIEEYNNARDLNVVEKTPRSQRVVNQNHVGMKINFGKKHGFDVKSLFGLINSNKSLKGIEIGKISLMLETSTFSIDKKDADRVKKFLNMGNFRGKKIQVTMNNDSNTYSDNRRNKSNFDRKRGNRNNRRKRNFKRSR